ncbi:MAG: hypothetical protein PHW04_17505 [Candidatus Wallbacteria bacterium]|nr:hypothetical protein [Candidatus Wallbacteria bacterium]
MKKELIILCLFLAVAAFAFGKSDFQVTIQENVINSILPQVLGQQGIASPCLQFCQGGSFVFTCQYWYKIVFYKWRPVEIHGHVGVTPQGDVDIALTEGYATYMDVDISRWLPDLMAQAVCNINSSNGNPEYKVGAEYVCNGGLGAVRLKLSSKVFLDGMENVILKNIAVGDGYLTLASTNNIVPNNQGEVQGYVGMDIVLAAIKKFAGKVDNGDDNFSINDVGLNLGNGNAALTFDVNDNGQGVKFVVNTGIEGQNVNLVKLIIKSISIVAGSADTDGHKLLEKVVKVINQNLQKFNITTVSGLMQLDYQAQKSISFNIDFNCIMRLKVTPQIVNVNLQAGYVGATAMVN